MKCSYWCTVARGLRTSCFDNKANIWPIWPIVLQICLSVEHTKKEWRCWLKVWVSISMGSQGAGKLPKSPKFIALVPFCCKFFNCINWILNLLTICQFWQEIVDVPFYVARSITSEGQHCRDLARLELVGFEQGGASPVASEARASQDEARWSLVGLGRARSRWPSLMASRWPSPRLGN